MKKKVDYAIDAHGQEYVANSYVTKSIVVMMMVFTLTFLLNVTGIFVIQQELMLSAYILGMVIFFLLYVIAKVVPRDNPKLKYILLFGVAVAFTVVGIFITYHVVIIPAMLFLFAALYSSRTVMRYSYVLVVLSTLCAVYGGYYVGLCDANMTLLTSQRLANYVVNGEFILTQINTNPKMSLMLFFVIPRCLIYIAFMAACSSIFEIVKKSAEKARRADELEQFQAELEEKVREQTKEIRYQKRKMEDLLSQTITALSEAVDAKDRHTSGHSRRVAQYAYLIAERMGKSQQEQEDIYRAGLLHDMGKLRIPADIINKPGKLTDDEYNIMKVHPAAGYHILRSISEDGSIAVAARYHHERYDGKGYPNGLSGENIPEIARIIGVADAYDAMTSNRSYRSVLPQEVVRAEIERCKGTQFDAEIADVMLQMIDEDTDYMLKQSELKRRTILTVDSSEEGNRELTDIMKDEPMYRVISASTGEEALEYLEQEPVDLVLVDIGILEDDGLETIDALRALARRPIIIMTDNNAASIAKAVSEYGCDDHITKPFLPILVKEIIYNMTERAGWTNY